MHTPTTHFDFIVIGAGSGGVRAARLAAERGARVALVEGDAIGGTCVNRGCVPKKLMRLAADYADAFASAPAWGWRDLGRPRMDWAQFVARRNAEVERLRGVYAAAQARAGTTVLRGWGRLLGGGRVGVFAQPQDTQPGRVLQGGQILIAVGGEPTLLPIPGGERAISSDGIFALTEVPARLVVVGGGYIGCEFASMFAALGSRVTLLHRGARLLPHMDDAVSAALLDGLRAQGVDVRLGIQLTRLGAQGARTRAVLADGKTLLADVVLAATGRRPRLDGLGLDAVGVALDERGRIAVDAVGRTRAKGVWAVGDVAAPLALTPVAIAQGQRVVDALWPQGGQRPLDLALVPTAVFTRPEVAACGLTEAAARAAGLAVRVHQTSFRAMGEAFAGGSQRTVMKLVADGRGRVRGVHLVGEHAAEVMQALAIALQAGVTLRQWDATVGIHPTAAEEWLRMPVV